MDDKADRTAEGTTKLEDRIKQVLTEARVVLPGAQALFGFQFTVVLTDAFERLAACAKYIHLISMAFTAVSIMLLMAPAAYHRIVEQGEDSEELHQVASIFLLMAMVPLILGTCMDFSVFALKATGSLSVAAAGAGILSVFFMGLWFGYPLYVRCRERSPAVPSNSIL